MKFTEALESMSMVVFSTLPCSRMGVVTVDSDFRVHKYRILRLQGT